MTSTLQLQCLQKGGRFTLRHLPQRRGLILRQRFHANEETAPRSDSIAIEILRAFPVAMLARRLPAARD
jgi:hypothetical protein